MNLNMSFQYLKLKSYTPPFSLKRKNMDAKFLAKRLFDLFLFRHLGLANATGG